MEIRTPSGVVSYRKTGYGDRNIILFHGFNQDHTAFDAIVPTLEEKYTVYSFDLPFHGNSDWQIDTSITPKNWKTLFSHFLRNNNIQSFDMMAFSIGCRFLFTTLTLFPMHVRKIFLIAPDGIKTSGWYTLATSTTVSRKIFKNVLNSKSALFNLTKLASSLKLVDRITLKLIERQLQPAQNRARVYATWICFRKLKTPLHQLKHILLYQAIDVHLLIAKNDMIIPYKRVKPLKEAVPNINVIEVTASHHQLLRYDYLKMLPF